MNTKLFPILLGLILSFSSFGLTEENLGDKIAAAEFFEKIQGEYQILIAGIQVPKEDNKKGYVLLDSGELSMIFPYCHKDGGVCDPGFRDFSSENTEVYKNQVETHNTIFTLIKTEGEKTLRYTWETRNNIVHFLDPQYTLVSGEAYPLEFILEKLPEPPPKPVEP